MHLINYREIIARAHEAKEEARITFLKKLLFSHSDRKISNKSESECT